MIPAEISDRHIKQAARWIAEHGVPASREAYRYWVGVDGRPYPPKYLISVACRFATGTELHPDRFIATEAVSYFRARGYPIDGRRKARDVENQQTVCARAVASLLPEAAARHAALVRLAASIELAHAQGMGCWSLTFSRNRIRLNVGRIEVLAIVRGALHLVLWRHDGSTEYVSVPGSKTVDLSGEEIVRVLPAKENAHRLLVRKAATTASRSTWAKHHAPGFIEYLERELGLTLPQPDYVGATQSSSNDRLLDDEAGIAVREGRLRWVIHLRKERDRSIVAKKKAQVLRETGELRCEACKMTFLERYGVEFCEVHHLKPLDTIDEETTTRLKDLVILCANCHRAIHRIVPVPLNPSALTTLMRSLDD